MKIDSIQQGIVIDHIKAGASLKIYNYLGLGALESTVAIIQNVKSGKMGRKDIIKIDQQINLNLDALGYLDPGVTISIIKDGVTVEKRKVTLPQRIVNVVKCKNPRCITSAEQDIDHIFALADTQKAIYRCIYCEQN